MAQTDACMELLSLLLFYDISLIERLNDLSI